MNPTRFPGGLTTSTVNDPTGAMGQLDPTKFHTFFNDFDTFNTGDWAINEIGAGGTSALGAGDGGLLVLTTDALDNDAIQIQNTVASFLMASGKQAFFRCRLKIEDATQSDLLVGLAALDSTVFDVTDGIFFQKDDGDALVDFYVQKDASTGRTSTVGITSMANDTFIELAWHYDGSQWVTAYVNGVLTARLSAASTYLPDTVLTPTVAYRAGEAGAIACTVDYILVAKER